jgi:hypothetical protein
MIWPLLIHVKGSARPLDIFEIVPLSSDLSTRLAHQYCPDPRSQKAPGHIRARTSTRPEPDHQLSSGFNAGTYPGVDGFSVWLTEYHFGRDIRQSPRYRPLSLVSAIDRVNLPLLRRMHAPSEISNFDFPLHVQQQVLWFDISMYDIMVVKIRQSSSDLSDVLPVSNVRA